MMQSLFGIAEKIATPLSLAALMLLILFYLFRILFQRLKLERVVGPDVYKIVMRAMTYLFALAVIALVLGLLSYAVTMIFGHVKTARVDSLLKELQSQSIVGRVSAIDGLADVAQDTSVDIVRICDSLTTFVRTTSAEIPETVSVRLSNDIQRAMKVLSLLIATSRCRNIDLSGSDLRRLQLQDGTLKGAKLTNTKLDQANLAGADLSGTRLMGATLTETVARKAKFRSASVHEVNWRRADLTGADFSSAQGLAGADFMSSQMESIILDNTDLTDTKLSNDPMTNASFKKADIRKTSFDTVIGVCKEQLDLAIGPPKRKPSREC
jgi:hypothetical protein